jgi:hypothetical protein
MIKYGVLAEEYWRGEPEVLCQEAVPTTPRSIADITCSVL